MKDIDINTEYIKLDQFLKWSNIVNTGSDAKYLINNFLVKVNENIETRRGKKLYQDDIIEVEGEKYRVNSSYEV
ncbi:MAG: S4 domain-containing protein YaaA [Fusobacteriota bacterium]